MRLHTIAPTLHMSVGSLASTYVATFGVLWLFIEPLGAFGLTPQLTGWSSIAMYGLLLLVPALLLPFMLSGFRWYKTHDLPFISLVLQSTVDGVTYPLRVAANMQVGEALIRIIEILRAGPGKEQVDEYLKRYYPVLQVRRGDAFHDIDANLTIHAAGLQDNDECQIRGQLHEYFNEVRFSRSTPNEDKNDT